MFERENALNVLTDAQIETIHEQAMRILEEIGTDVLHEPSKKLLADAGMSLVGDRVRWDRGFVMEQVAKAPSTFRLKARNPERSLVVGEGEPVLMNVGGPPFASDMDEGRRSGRMQDHDTLVKMTQAADVLNCVQIGAVEATDLDVALRHMDMEYSAIRWSDKPYTTYGTSGPRARDGVRMAEIVHGGRDAIEAEPVLMGVVNPNSPLIWDFRMTDALTVWAEANQPIIVTPFLLAGATSAVSVAGGLAQQVAEALSGVALAQLIRPGVPCLYGSFFTVTDMRTGSPAFGTPESVLGVLAGGQLARRYGLPFRGGGGLASSPAVDAQAAAESQMMLWATMLAGTDVVLHAAGWLEGGLTANFEKFALDVELLDAVPAAAPGDRVHGRGARVRRARRGGPRGPVPVIAAHAGPLQGVALHEPALPDARLRDVGDDGRGNDGRRGEPPLEGAAGVLRGPRHRSGRRRRAAGVHGAAQARPARAGGLSRTAQSSASTSSTSVRPFIVCSMSWPNPKRMPFLRPNMSPETNSTLFSRWIRSTSARALMVRS